MQRGQHAALGHVRFVLARKHKGHHPTAIRRGDALARGDRIVWDEYGLRGSGRHCGSTVIHGGAAVQQWLFNPKGDAEIQQQIHLT